MSFSVAPLSHLSYSSLLPPQHKQPPHFVSLTSHPKLHTFPNLTPLQASRRIHNFPQGNDVFAEDSRNWSRAISQEFDDGDDDDDDEEDEGEEDRSLDLLVRFVENVFRKVSKRARKAVRSVLPASIPSKLVGFSVNGVLVLAFLWILKAFLQVICTLGSVVFASILLIRGVWTGIAYLQENRNQRLDGLDDDSRTWRSGAQPVA